LFAFRLPLFKSNQVLRPVDLIPTEAEDLATAHSEVVTVYVLTDKDTLLKLTPK
jgi:hypothetical protein